MDERKKRSSFERIDFPSSGVPQSSTIYLKKEEKKKKGRKEARKKQEKEKEVGEGRKYHDEIEQRVK